MLRGVLIVLACAVLIQCESHFFIYKGGKLVRGKEEPTEIFGRVNVVTNVPRSYVELNGMYMGARHSPFFFGLAVGEFVEDGDKILISGACEKAGWDGKVIDPVSGTYKITGTWSKATLVSDCTDPEENVNFKVNLEGTSSECEIYTPLDAASRAHYLIGELKEHFLAYQVLNFAYYDYPYLAVMKNCRYYLNNVGTVTTEMNPGYIIVAKDGMHCAVIDKEGDKFIHMNPAKQMVMDTPITMIKDFFKSGYVIKKPPCKGPHTN